MNEAAKLTLLSEDSNCLIKEIFGRRNHQREVVAADKNGHCRRKSFPYSSTDEVSNLQLISLLEVWHTVTCIRHHAVINYNITSSTLKIIIASNFEEQIIMKLNNNEILSHLQSEIGKSNKNN